MTLIAETLAPVMIAARVTGINCLEGVADH